MSRRLTFSLGLLLVLGGAREARGLSRYFVPPGSGNYFASLSDRPAIADCGWAGTSIKVGPDTIRYHFRKTDTDLTAVVILSHESTCLEVTRGQGAQFCVVLEAPEEDPPSPCGPPILKAEIEGGIERSRGWFRWIEPLGRTAPSPPEDPKPIPKAEVVEASRSTPMPASMVSQGDREARPFSLFLLVIAAFLALRARRLGEILAGMRSLPRSERIALGAILFSSVAVGTLSYGKASAKMWEGLQTFTAGGLLRTPVDAATLEGLRRALLFASLESPVLLLLAHGFGLIGLCYLFALLRRFGPSSVLSLAAVAVVALSPTTLRFASAEPAFLLSWALGLAALYEGRSWFEDPEPLRFWSFATAWLAVGWLVSGPWMLLALPVFVGLERVGRKGPERGWTFGVVGGLLLFTIGLAIWAAASSPHADSLGLLAHRTPTGIALRYQLIHPVLGGLFLLGLLELTRQRGAALWLGILGVLTLLTFTLGGTLGHWSILTVHTFVALPLSLLTVGGVFAAARRLPEAPRPRALLLLGALLLVAHYELLFHGTFGRLIFS